MAQWSWLGSRETGSSTAVEPRVQPNMSKTPQMRMRTGRCIEGGAPYSARDTRWVHGEKAVAIVPEKLAGAVALSHSLLFQRNVRSTLSIKVEQPNLSRTNNVLCRTR